jgi:hypothetical protein
MIGFKIASTLLLSLFAVNIYAKNLDADAMTPPKPLNNPVYDRMIGTWSGQSNMMGEKTNDTIKISWTLNHQFILLELKAVGVHNPKLAYEGLGIFGLDEKGQPKTWWYDSWGANAMVTGKGHFKNDMLVINDSNQMFSEVRTFKVEGNQMTMTAKGSMKMNDKEIPLDQTVVYKKAL